MRGILFLKRTESMLLSAGAGVALIPVGCASSSLGLLLMKSAAEEDSSRPLVLSPRWLLGFVMLGIVATAVDVIVLGIFPLSVVAPFSGLTIVFSLLLARTGWLCAKEMLSWADIKSISLMLVGVTLVSAFGPRDEGGPPSLATLVAAMLNPRLAIFSCVALGSAVARLQLKGLNRSGVWRPVLSAFAATGCGTLSQLSLKLVSTSVGSLSLPGSLTTLALSIAALAIVAPLHLRLLNLTLSSSAVALGVPLYQSLLIGCTTAAGGILFGEFDAMPAGLLATYGAGVATATAGIALLSRSAAATAVATEDDEDDEDEDAAEAVAEGGYVRRTSPSTAATELMAAKLGYARPHYLGYAMLEARDAQYPRPRVDSGRSRAASLQPASMQQASHAACAAGTAEGRCRIVHVPPIQFPLSLPLPPSLSLRDVQWQVMALPSSCQCLPRVA